MKSLKSIAAPFVFSLIIFSFVLTSCKKDEPAPIAITVEPEMVIVNLNNTSTTVAGFGANFYYEGVKYSIGANQVLGEGSGTITVSNTDIFSTATTVEKASETALKVINPNLPISFRVKLNSFPFVYGTSGSVAGNTVDVYKFNDITLQLSPNTLFYFSSSNDNDFVGKYLADITGFKTLSKKMLSAFNDNKPSVSGDQPMAVNPNVYK